VPIHELFGTQKLAVLATQSNGQPYTSLVAFSASGDLASIYFATSNTTYKYSNLTNDNRVAVLVNNSNNQTVNFQQAIAVSAIGKAQAVIESDKPAILKQYLAKHPHLEEFASSPTCALVRISVKTYYLVTNFQDVRDIHIS
jgi:heme iron utilization protein